MDRFQRYAFIIGPIVGAILVFLIFSAMSDQLQSDQEALSELGPVTLQEVAQNPALLAEDEGEGEAEAAAEEGMEATEEGDAETPEIDAETASTPTTEVEVAIAVTVTEDGEVTDVLTATTQITPTDEMTAGQIIASAMGTGTDDSADAAAEEEGQTEAAEEAPEEAEADTTVESEETAVTADAGITETSVITATDEVVIAASVTDTERILTGALVAENVVWFLLRYVDSSGEPTDVLEDSAITALFDGTTISGSTGCSNYAGRYTADEEGIFTVQLSAVAPAGTQPESCVDGGELNVQEADYFAALSNAATFTADDAIFEVSDADGNVILHYEVTESSQ